VERGFRIKLCPLILFVCNGLVWCIKDTLAGCRVSCITLTGRTDSRNENEQTDVRQADGIRGIIVDQIVKIVLKSVHFPGVWMSHGLKFGLIHFWSWSVSIVRTLEDELLRSRWWLRIIMLLVLFFLRMTLDHTGATLE